MLLDREEYIEQAYFFRVLGERIKQDMQTQELLVSVREEVLSTTKLPMAIDFMRASCCWAACSRRRWPNCPITLRPFRPSWSPRRNANADGSDFASPWKSSNARRVYRAEGATRQGAFVYQFECLCRNRLGYDKGLDAMSRDPIYTAEWAEWMQTVRRQVGLVDIADMIYVRSEHYLQIRQRQGLDLDGPEKPVLFGEKEGKIALANRRRDPLLLFSALERHLNYPQVPRPKPADDARLLLPMLVRRMERVESRLKLLEEEEKGGIDLTRFYGRPPEAGP